MELKNYMQVIFRWIWLLLLCMFLGTSSGYIASRLGKPTYQAISKILVSKDLSDQNSQFAAMNNQQIIDAYVQLLTSTSVIDEASQRLNFEINLKESGLVRQVQSTNVIEIIWEDDDPQRAAAIVNTLVDVLIDQNEQASGYTMTEKSIKENITQVEGQITTLQTQLNQISDEKLQSQLRQVNNQITTLQDQILKLSTEIGSLASLTFPSAEQSGQLVEKQAQLAQLQSQLTQYQQIRINLEFIGKPVLNSNEQISDVQLQLLQSTLDQYQNIYLDLLNNLQTVQLARLRNAPTIDQIEKAIPPAEPVRPQPGIYSALGGIVGLVLAIGLIFIIEYLDDTLRTPQDIQKGLGVPVLGYIANLQRVSNMMKGFPAAGWLHSDAIDALRTNLEFAGAQSSLKTLLLLGVNEPDIGKTSIVTDLAVSYAQSGSKVVLLDADLRNPRVHRYFGLANEDGYSELLAGDAKPGVSGKKVEGLDGLTVITGGNASLDSATSAATDVPTLTRPNRIVKVLELFRKMSDVTIINAPPITVVDSWVLASKVDGVLLVIQPGVAHLSDAHLSLEQLNRAGATIMGVVLYEVSRNSLADYYRRFRRTAKKAIKLQSRQRPSPQKEAIIEPSEPETDPQKEAAKEPSEPDLDLQKEVIGEQSEPEPDSQDEVTGEPSEPDSGSQDKATEEQSEPAPDPPKEVVGEQSEPDSGSQDKATEEQSEPAPDPPKEVVGEQSEPDSGSQDEAIKEPSEPKPDLQKEKPRKKQAPRARRKKSKKNT